MAADERASPRGDEVKGTSPVLSGDTMIPPHEESPLLSPSGEEEQDGLMNAPELDTGEDHYDDTKGFWYMILLTISLAGLQLAWAVELSNGAPYILSLGLSKSIMALVWLAGPLSGALVQPYVGILSDNSRSRFGKRRPFMIAGASATITSLVILAWVKEIVGGILSLFGADIQSTGVKNTIIAVAVFFVYVLDFSIATVQAGIRAFILDCAPSHQQEVANSYASRVLGIGNILGYAAGYVDLPKLLPFLGNTQFKVLCIIASIGLGSTVLLSSITIQERDPRKEPPPPKGKDGILSFIKKIFTSIKNLPPLTRQVCEVEFLAWIGFFPQLFYTSSYIADIYVQPFLESNPNMTPSELDTLYEAGTRVGSFALLMYAITSLSTNILLPFFIAPTYDLQLPSSAKSILSQTSTPTRTSRFLSKLIIPWLTLRRAWLISHLIFATCMFLTLLARSVAVAATLVAFIGISWAMTLWAPFAMISAEVSKRGALRRARQANANNNENDGTSTALTLTDEEEDQAGLILGIHNMSVSTPQLIATVGSSIVFKFLQKPRGVAGDRSFPVVMALGGVFTLVAAWLTSRIKDEIEIEGLVESGAEEGRAAGGVGGDRGGRPRLGRDMRSEHNQALLREGGLGEY